MAPGSSQPGRAVQGPLGSGTFHHQQPTSALAPPASMAWTCSQGSLAGSPCSRFHAEAKTPQPWGLGKLGVGMVLKGGLTHSGSVSVSSQGPCVSQGVCRALGRCSLTLARAAWSLVSYGGTKQGPGGGGAGDWRRCGPHPGVHPGQKAAFLAPASRGRRSHTYRPGRRPWRLWAQVPSAPGASCSTRGHVPRTKARSGWGRLCNPALSWASSMGR